MTSRRSKMARDKKTLKRKRPKSAGQAKQERSDTKKTKTESDFTEVKFRFLLRSPETVVTALQTFLEHSVGDEDKDDSAAGKSLWLLEEYCRHSPMCSEILELLDRPQKHSNEISLIFTWLRFALKECKEVTQNYSAFRQHIVSTLLTKHMNIIMNSLRQGNKPSHAKATILMLSDVVQMGYKYAKLIHTHFDFNHSNLPYLLTQRDRKDLCDMRAALTIFLMRLLLADEAEITRALVDQKVLLQDVLKGLCYDRSHYVIFILNTVHSMIVKNETVGKTAKFHLFNTPVLKELLTLYQWPGPKLWKRQPTDEEKREYTSEQREVAEALHPFLVDLCADTKLGICFRDKKLGMSSENKNPAISKVLQALLSSYTTPMSHKLAAAILKACPDQMNSFLKQLQPHLVPRPVDTWLACVQFFIKIMQGHDWPAGFEFRPDSVSDEKVSHLLQFLFPSDTIISTFKDGLKHPCATVRHKCLQALETIVLRGQRYLEICKQKFEATSPPVLGIEGVLLRVIPSPQVMINLMNKLSAKEGFLTSISKDLYKDTDVQVPTVSRFQHLVAILKLISLAPDIPTSGLADVVPLMLTLTREVYTSEDDIDRPPEGVLPTFPSLCLLHALSRCDAKKLPLFAKGGNKGDAKSGLLYQMICLMQTQSQDTTYRDMAQHMIVKLLMSTGLFEGHEQELGIWLQNLENVESAPAEVILFFVDILHKFSSNPYPAIDHLLEVVEESPQLIDGCYLPYVRLEFSPLPMLALKSDYYSSEKVHQYVCCVLVDILHSLQNSFGFSKLVHSLSEHLDPAVTLYLTLHTHNEQISIESVQQRLGSKPHLKQVSGPKVTNPGLALLRSLLKGGNSVEDAVAKLSPSRCLSLVQQCLMYLRETGVDREKEEFVIKNKKHVRLFVETIQTAFLRLKELKQVSDTGSTDSTSKSDSATSSNETEMDMADEESEEKGDKDDGNSGDEIDSEDEEDMSMDDKDIPESKTTPHKGETSSVSKQVDEKSSGSAETAGKYCVTLQSDFDANMSTASLQHLSVDWFCDALLYLLRHPLMSKWLFSKGFTQPAEDAEWFCAQLCNAVTDILSLVDSFDITESVSGVLTSFQQQICSLLENASKVPSSLQPLLGKCVDTFFSKTGQKSQMPAFVALLRLPLDCFVKEEHDRIIATDLGETILQMITDMEMASDTSAVNAADNVSDAISKSPSCVSVIKPGIKEGLNCVPTINSASISKPSEDLTLNDFEQVFVLLLKLKDPRLESFTLNCIQSSPELALACSEEVFLGLLRDFEKVDEQRRTLLESLMMLNPVCRILIGNWFKENKGKILKKETVFGPLVLKYVQILQRTGGDPTQDAAALLIAEVLSRCSVENLAETYLQTICYLIHCGMLEASTVQKIGCSLLQLMGQDVHIRAAHIQVLATILRHQMLGKDEGDDDHLSWDEVLGACLQYMHSEAMTKQRGWSGQDDTVACIVETCHAALDRTLSPTKSQEGVQFWPELVKSCLKYHYRNAKVLSLLRRLVLQVFTEEDNSSRDNDEEMETQEPDTTTDDVRDNDDRDDEDGDEDNDEAENDRNTSISDVQKSYQNPFQRVQRSYQFTTCSSEPSRRAGLTDRSEIAEKYSKHLSTKIDTQFPDLYPTAEFVKRTVQELFPSGRYFIRQRRFDSAFRTSKLKLSSSDYSSLVLDLCEKCVSHSEFLDVMRGGDLQDAKSELVHLFAILVQLERQCCAIIPQKVLLAAYNATLSLTDQYLLYLMMACEEHQGKVFSPGLWGEAAVEDMEVQQQLGKSLIHEAQLKQILDHIDASTMEKSIVHFPLLRTMVTCDEGSPQVMSAKKMMSQDECYDPRFFLLLFSKFLGPEHFVDIREFIKTNCLGFILAALSSHDALMRSFAFQALADFFSHVEGARRLPAKDQYLAFRDVIKESITKENQKLAGIITLFLARSVQVISDPGHAMYMPIAFFLLLKPALDVMNVPELYQFLHSPKPQERGWLFQLLQDGLRETSDHRIFERRYVYKLLMCHASSSLNDAHSRRQAVQVLVQACSIATVAKDMVMRHGLLAWLVNYITDALRDYPEDVKVVCDLLHRLWHTTAFNRSKVWWLTLPQLARECLLLSPVQVCVHTLLSKFSTLDVQSVLCLLGILHNPEQPSLSALRSSSSPGLIAAVLWHLGRLSNDADATFTSQQLVDSLGLKLPSSNEKVARKGVKPVNIAEHVEEKEISQLRHLTLCLILEWDVSHTAEECFQAVRDEVSSHHQTGDTKLETVLHVAFWILQNSCHLKSSGYILELVAWVDKVIGLAFPSSGSKVKAFPSQDGKTDTKLKSILESFLQGYRTVLKTLQTAENSDVLFTSRDFFPTQGETCRPFSCTEKPSATNSISQKSLSNRSSFSDILASFTKEGKRDTLPEYSTGSSDSSEVTDISEGKKEGKENSVVASHQFLSVGCHVLDPNSFSRSVSAVFCKVGHPSWHGVQQSLCCLPYQAASFCLNVSLMRILAANKHLLDSDGKSILLKSMQNSHRGSNDGVPLELLTLCMREIISKGTNQARSKTMWKIYCDKDLQPAVSPAHSNSLKSKDLKSPLPIMSPTQDKTQKSKKAKTTKSKHPSLGKE